MRPRRAVLLLLLCLAACAQPQQVVDPTIGMHIGSDGRVYPSVAGSAGGVTLGAGSGGGFVGTRFGPLRLSAGF
ncbi:hypothetical protein [Pseudogemmobacter faecipullorum]|uniref:Uncharacterized protein n=1 Tax=Pseudogemmobacter faecipullorum TaxID=2755041 RepID=A0ABS8CHD5_9RHOB|nr:hypothetical protein [Pseudogemmobacter faecipullorum]MCB5408801.1 hypothetical protein [Pseudogemmobacter faecipullorum]